MKIACTLLLVLMLLFAAVQYNDPDGLLWAAVYAIPATFMAFGAVRPARLRRLPARVSLGVALGFLAVLGTLLWPDQPGFWHAEVWWEQETAREGMGAAIAFAVTAFALPLALPPRTAP